MDIKEIIKWFIPCFHILLAIFVKMDSKLTLVFLFLFFNSCPTYGVKLNSVDVDARSLSENIKTKNVQLIRESKPMFNQSDVFGEEKLEDDEDKSLDDTSVGRTFGRPFKKMMAGLLPLIFQIGAASTWAVVAALVGVKTLVVTLAILKLLLVAGAAKFGALFLSKGHHQSHSHGWEPPHHPQKEIHLHIHNGHVAHEEHHPPAVWNRNEIEPVGTKSYVLDPYQNQYMTAQNQYAAGPQTISTPYGNYVKIDGR